MIIKGQMENPEEVEFTLTITMKMKEWDELKEQLKDKYPGWKISGAITTMWFEANKDYQKEITS